MTRPITKYALKDMTFVEVRERLAGKPVILLPLGSQEVQGPQGPMGDFMLSERLAEQVAQAADAVAAPTLPFGYADVFRPVLGGMQLRPETFCAVLEDMITSFLDHGQEHLVIFNGHTGNSGLISQTVRRIKRERGVIIPSIDIWKIIPDSLWRRLHGEAATRAPGHGADPIASVYLHLFPELQRPDLVQPATARTAFGKPTIGLSGIAFDGVQIHLPLDVTDLNDNGLIGGDASLSTAEIGAALADHIVGVTAAFVRHFRGCNPRSFAG